MKRLKKANEDFVCGKNHMGNNKHIAFGAYLHLPLHASYIA